MPAFTAALQAFPGASDFNFTVNKKPQIEVNGELKNLEFGLFKSELTPEQTRQVVSIVTGELPRTIGQPREDRLLATAPTPCRTALVSA
jgi:hypothetical protein